MNITHPDFLAFRSRLLLASVASGLPHRSVYERRDTSGLAATLEQIADGFERHRTVTGTQVAELQAAVEQLQTRLARPGALTSPIVPAASTRTAWAIDGRPAPVLHGPDEVRQHFSARSAGASAEAAGIGMSAMMRAVAGLAAPPEARAVVNTGTAADGGHLVPAQLMSAVLEAMVPESSVLVAGAGMIPLDAGVGKTFTLAAVDGIPVPAFRAENGGVDESSPTFRAITMTPRSLSVFFKVSREWLMDAVGTDTVLTMVLAQAFAKRLDLVALRGSGTAPEPAGLASTSGVIPVGNGANGASLGTTRYGNFFSAVQQILEADGRMPTAAIMSPRSRVVLASQNDTTGQPLQVPPMLQPLRMLATSQLPNNLTVGSSNDCSQLFVGYFPHLLYAMREQMSIQRLSEAFATNGQLGFLAHMRVDVAVTYPKSFAVVSGVRP